MLDKHIRLTRNDQNKVIKVEIYVDKVERCEIFQYFPDKTVGWKEAAPHFLLLRGLAAYEKKKLVKGDSLKDPDKKAKIDQLTQLTKELCHKTASLYQLVNHSYWDNPFHPASKEWQQFCKRNKNSGLNKIRLKIAFLQEKLNQYQVEIEQTLNEYSSEKHLKLADIEAIKKFRQSHQEITKQFIAQLNRLDRAPLSENQLRKLFSNQDEADSLNIRSLGGFLRSQAHQLAEGALTAADDITEARFDQLFSFSAHPLHKELAKAKKSIGDLESTHMVRFLNTRSPIPAGQLAVIENDNSPDSEKGWMDIMPYVERRTFLIEGIDGSEGLDDIDQILSVYANGAQPIKKPNWVYEALAGKKGILAFLGIVFLGLPAIVGAAAALVVGTCLAITIDGLGFLLQALVFLVCSPVIIFGVIADFLRQIPTFFTEKAETDYSLLAKMMKWDFPPQEFSDTLRKISVVRIFKQFLLDKWHEYYDTDAEFIIIDEAKIADKELKWEKSNLLEQIRENQAEGLFNVVASKIFSFPAIAGFLHEKLKQLFYALREFRKVINVTVESVYYFFAGNAKQVQQTQRENLSERLNQKIKSKNEEIIGTFLVELEKVLQNKNPEHLHKKTDPDSDSDLKLEPSKDIPILKQNTWASVVPWVSRQVETPLDFISDIAAGAVGTVDFAFTEDPGIATPMFVLALLCAGALLFPSLAGVIPPQVVNSLQWLPKQIAKAFMGKLSLETGLSGMALNIISNFLQWQLMTYGIKGALEVYHGNFEWVRTLFERPEEITLGAATFVSMGYAVGLIPNLPPGVNIFPPSSHPFLIALGNYPTGIYNGFSNTFNAIINESTETAHHGAFGLNTLELAFIGLKSILFIYGLVSGTHQVSITPLNLDTKKLCEDYEQAGAPQRKSIIHQLLRQHGISDPNSTLATKITDALRPIAPQPEIAIKNPSPEEQAFIKTREKLKKYLKMVQDMEVLGIAIDLDLDNNNSSTNYQSKLHAELIYDELFFAIEEYNQAARKVGLFHEQIDGNQFLHNFYNKHCYAGSSGWHKILFGILLFPVTWIWRGFKYLVGTPSMRQQVKKSFCKDFAMLLQLIPDVIAPISRSFLKASMYAVRMILGILVLPLLINAIGINLIIFTLGLVGILPVSIFAIIRGAQENSAVTFATIMQEYFNGIKLFTDDIWNSLLCNSWVNDYLKLISFVGGTSGTGSPHRLNILKTIGMASLYEYLTSTADTSSENLQLSTCQLSTKLETDSVAVVNQQRQGVKKDESIGKILKALTSYNEEAENRILTPVSSDRPKQLAYLSESLLTGSANRDSHAASSEAGAFSFFPSAQQPIKISTYTHYTSRCEYWRM